MIQPQIPFTLNCTFSQLFGWDLETLWQIANRQLCLALVQAGKLAEAFESYRSMMDMSNEATKASLRAWFSGESFL
jgi:hypothetical protein